MSEIQRMTASDVLSQHWDGYLHVCPKKIAQSMGVTLKEFDAAIQLDRNHVDHGLSGKFEFEGDTPVCYYNSSEPLLRQNFTIAHELGHYALGHGKSFRDPVSNFSSRGNEFKEIQANDFAAQLLMPKSQVLGYIRERGIVDIGKLADIFKVSQVAMKYRLKNLGVLR
ncbi:MAG: ImmA/IrrE family metallo-endopeptidase [Gammaproteobacteria bacterium]|nr:ImmA/IrrE family metallo-endopeptidase [Gammaproteobacteria bacterium]